MDQQRPIYQRRMAHDAGERWRKFGEPLFDPPRPTQPSPTQPRDIEPTLFDRLDRVARRVIAGFLWLGTAYFLAHVLVAAGVGR